MNESTETSAKTDVEESDTGAPIERLEAQTAVEENVVIIGNSSDNLSCLDPSVVRYVHQLLLQADGQQSVVIVKEGGNSEEMYQFELMSDQAPEVCSENSDNASSVALSTGSASESTLKDCSTDASSSSKPGQKPVLEEANGAKGLYTVKPFGKKPSEQSVTPTISLPSTEELSENLSSNRPDAALRHQNSCTVSSHSHTSQTAENLLDIAHKIISTKQQADSELVSNVPHHMKNEGDKPRSESVLTMYLSSPSELKTKLKVLKDNSPVVVVQAQSDVDKPSGTGREVADANPTIAAEKIKPNGSSQKETTDKTPASKTSTPERQVDVPATQPEGGEECVYRCQECGYSSHNKHYYKQHVDLVHNEDRPYKCPHCDYAGKRRHALLEHMVVHSNNRPFTCGHCNASFRKKGHLTNHIKLHTSQKLVHCGVCNIQLPDSEAFQAHLRKIHNTDKLYKCKLCDHTVVDREALIKHFQTHTDPVPLVCPVCKCQVPDERSLEEHMQSVHGSLNVPGSCFSTVGAMSWNRNHKNGKGSLAKIMCSECGFVSPDEETMQKHMWSHIKTEPAQSGELILNSSEASKENSMGVLKQNINSGQKSLPRDVFYQCTSCAFTSSDNSAFIKHMLAHKTQEKHVREATAEVKGHLDGVRLPSSGLHPIPASSVLVPYAEVLPAKSGEPQVRPENSVPFIYDKASARFRCLICNYHCEFQRTIKAHIWKHSGHQNIEYPMFDQSGNAMSGSVNVSNDVKSQSKFLGTVNECLAHINVEKEKSRKVSVPVNHQSFQVSQIAPKDRVQGLPGNIATVSSKPGDCSKVKGTTTSLSISLKVEKIPGVTSEEQKTSGRNKSELAKEDTGSCPVDGLEKILVQTASCVERLDGSSASLRYKVKNTVDAAEVEGAGAEVCPEPSVVVEAVNTIPPGFSLTGLKSLQGSPRVSDLESSGGDSKFVTQVRAAVLRSRDNSADSDTSVSGSERGRSLKMTVPVSVEVGDQPNFTSKLRCPFCDCQVGEDFKSHLLNCQAKVSVKSEEGEGKKAAAHLKSSMDELLSRNSREEPQDSLVLEDTDSTESSDETATSETSSSKKSGICSSLLAVIEQLRERSRSESEDDKQGHFSKKSGKKKGRQADLGLDSLSDLKNIEKISDKGGEKFRCVLCHYTSERIYNIKIHMKTHRQKKPTECSLCDFSSTSPEALQEHMLKHCKVRTYACKYCPQTFNHKSTLRAHMRAHKDQEPFLCAYCVFETTNAQEYQDHMQVHSGCSSRLRCPGCDLVLTDKDELTAHLLGCKGKTAGGQHVRVTSCADTKMNDKFSVIAGSELKRKKEVLENKHQGEITLSGQAPGGASETEDVVPQHACVVQGCTFSSSNLKELQDHLSIHCNPSLLVCNLCDFKAWHSRSLKSHMKRHANDQRYVQQPLEQYKCNLCGYVCHHLPSLKSHMWRHASDQSYSYEFTNDVINAAIDHDNRVDASGEADDPELLDQVINSERKILEGELTKCKRGDGQRPICWVTFRCCSCGFETINKAKLNIHMRTHSDLIQQAQALDIIPRRKRAGIDDKSQGLTASLPKMVKTEKL